MTNETGTQQPPENETANQETEAEKLDIAKKRAAEKEALQKKIKDLTARVREIENKESAQKRKDETRLKVLVGAATLADIDHTTTQNPGAGEKQKKELLALLNRAIQNKKDREFLQAQGWLK